MMDFTFWVFVVSGAIAFLIVNFLPLTRRDSAAGYIIIAITLIALGAMLGSGIILIESLINEIND